MAVKEREEEKVDVDSSQSDTYNDIRIKKVKVLGSRARAKAEEMNLDEEQLVIIKTRIASLPQYEIIPIEGSPTKFLNDKYLVPK